MKDTRFLTFGCRLNAYETQAMRDRAREAGLEGAVIVNSCAVTGEAVRQARQAIRRARREAPHAKIIVTGCAAQTQPEVFAAMPEVDHVIGNGEKLSAAVFADLADGSAERQRVGDIMQRAETAHHFIDGFGSRARAYVQVQNGCDHRCTFCIIPFGRGPSRSQPADTIITQVRDLVARGHAEIVLTGVDITAYGADLGGELSLGGLVRAILRQVPELRRLRLSSIDTIEADAALLAAIADEDRLMPHLHLSLQSGDDMILKRMRRRHSRADAVAFCATARRLRPEITFGADLIAGFPTESENMFENTTRLVEDCGLAFLHVFPFSPRPGTPAARMPQHAPQLVKERAQRLRQHGDTAVTRHLNRFTGQTIELLMENASHGRAADFTEMSVDREMQAGAFVHARVDGHRGGKLLGAALA